VGKVAEKCKMWDKKENYVAKWDEVVYT